jgi:hypothetical protein
VFNSLKWKIYFYTINTNLSPSNFSLRSEINYKNNITTAEIGKRINAGNKCLNGIRKYLKSNVIKRKTKILLYKSIIRPILTYACETWTLTKKKK